MNRPFAVRRVCGVEVFTVAGAEYVRTSPESATLTMTDWKTRGLPPLYLRPRTAASIVQAVERKARRLERRTARLRA